jgi:hypothetical protein
VLFDGRWHGCYFEGGFQSPLGPFRLHISSSPFSSKLRPNMRAHISISRGNAVMTSGAVYCHSKINVNVMQGRS